MTPSLKYNGSHVANGLGHLIVQFKEKPRLALVALALLTEVQAAEDALWQVLTKRLTDQGATGVQLDVLGRIVGQPREGLSDAAYLPLINARIRANKSDSTMNTLITILQLIVGTSTPILVREYPKAIEMEVDGVTNVNPYQVWREFLNVAKEAGTKMNFIASTAPATGTLTLTDASPASTFTTLVSQRIEDAVTPGGGGQLAMVFG